MEQQDVSIRVLGIPAFLPPASARVFPAKGFQLLALLAASPRMTRRQVAVLLWDGPSEAAALANLRQLLARIRHTAPALELVASAAGKLALGPDAACIDLVALDGALRQGTPEHWETALNLYRGELLDGAEHATDDFLRWVAVSREALRERVLDAAAALLIEWTRFGNAAAERIRALARRMLALDPEREATYRLLIEAFGRNSMFDDVEATLKGLEAMLRREHGGRPSPETVAIARRMLSARPGAPAPGFSAIEAAPERAPRVAILQPELAPGLSQGGTLRALVEEIANELARYRSIAVLAPHSSFQVDHDGGVPRDNSRLRCDYAVSGSVRRQRSGLVLSLRMVDCNGLDIVWAGQFEFTPAAIMQSFELIVTRITSSLASEIEKATVARLRRAGIRSAYLHYLQGEEFLLNCDLSRLRRARAEFVRASEVDPGFAPARARVATTLYLEWIQLGGTDPQLLGKAREEAVAAARLDPGSAVGHWTLATVALYQRDFDTCEAKFREAASLCPNSAELLVQHADALAHLGDPDDGWRKFERALDLNPLPPDRYWWAGASIAFRQKRYESVIELSRKLASDESMLGILAASHAYLGDMETARQHGRRYREIYPGSAARGKSMVGPDRLAEHREHRLHGLRLAGIL